MLSVALAATVRVPEIVAPAVGVMMEAAGGVMSVNVAVTVVAALRVTVQAPGPAQPPPLQPLKVEPAAGAAVSVTAVPLAKLAAQVAPQVMPAGLLVTLPAPVPALETVSVKVCRVKVAVTVGAALRGTGQAPGPEQPPPLQPLKVEPAAGAAVSVTAVPLVKLAVQIAPQVMPAGALVTAPLPVPALLTVSVKVGVKVAVTVVAAETVTTHDPVPAQPPPLQPPKVEPAAGAAVSVTAVPLAKLAVHVAPQVMPAGLLVTVSAPAPALETVSTRAGVKVAVTVVAAEIVTVQLPVPEQPPPVQPVKVEPAAGAAVSVMAAPLAKLAEQVAPQLIPPGALVTVPLPVPALLTVSVNVWSVNVVVTVVAAESVTVQGPVPEQPPPLQPGKVEPATGVAVNVTAVPLAKLAEQVAPQLIPTGELVTVPLPVPALLTLSV